MFSIIKSGMDTAMQELSMISNNISNSNSIGYKKSSVSFSEFYIGRTVGGVERALVGNGANAEHTRRSDAQGALIEMGGALDTAIVGNGYFMTERPADADVELADGELGFQLTRNGAFSLDSEGFLVSQDGDFVLGLPAVDGVTADLEKLDATALEKIQVPIEENEEPLSSIRIESNGNILAAFGRGDDTVVGTIPLSIFSNPNSLKQLGDGKYLHSALAGKFFVGIPNSSGFGNLETGYVEGSNVDITTEMTNMIRAQQQFNGSARMMQTNSDMIEKMTR